MAAIASDASFKIGELVDRFEKLAATREREINARKDAEDNETIRIRDNVTRLQATLNEEVKRRGEAHKALQGMFDSQMATIQDKLEAGLAERLQALHEAVESLNDRVDSVESDFSQSRERYIKDIEDKSTMVSKDVAVLQTAFQGERQERKERESIVVAKLKDLGERTAERFSKDLQTLEKQHAELREELEVALHEDNDKRFQDHILEEMAALKTGLVVESQTREKADDEIVLAISQYTQAIVSALKMVNKPKGEREES